MPVFKIHHVTKYIYDSPVRESINEIRIFPYPDAGQEVLQHRLQITGNPAVHQFTDYWQNTAGSFNLLAPHRELTIESKMVVRTITPPLLQSEAGLPELAAAVESRLDLLELSTADATKSEDALQEMIGSIYEPSKSIATMVKESCECIYQGFQYIKGITTVETTVDEILEHRSGVCQDFAHVLLQLLRTMKIPSRYVSGYICPNKNGMRGEGATHAWVEALIPGHGWAGIDPTNNVWVTDKHVKLAVGRNFNDCSPMKGTFKGQAEQKLSVYVSVGYEDGHIFEELNDVNMPAAKTKKPVLVQVQSQQQ